MSCRGMMVWEKNSWEWENWKCEYLFDESHWQCQSFSLCWVNDYLNYWKIWAVVCTCFMRYGGWMVPGRKQLGAGKLEMWIAFWWMHCHWQWESFVSFRLSDDLIYLEFLAVVCRWFRSYGGLMVPGRKELGVGEPEVWITVWWVPLYSHVSAY